jgi:hypothetical protein
MIQRRHMQGSCKAYDAGEPYEALRLATIVHTLVHDGGKIRSILSQMNVKHKILFIASGDIPAASLRASADRFTPLIELDRPAFDFGFVPICTYYGRRGKHFAMRELPFEDWWERDIIFFDDSNALTRKKLVFALRNQEGGSHYDREVRDPNYRSFTQPVLMFSIGRRIMARMSLLELATMRQIAEELKLSLAFYEWQQKLRHQSRRP